VVTPRGKGKNETNLPTQPIKHSPKKKLLSAITIKQEDINGKSKLGYNLKIIKSKPDFEVSWVDAMPRYDGFAQNLFNHITNENGFREFGLLMGTRRRIDQANNNKLINTKNKYARRVIVRALDGESTHELRLAILHAFQAFLMHPDNNKFIYPYTVGDDSNLTPHVKADLQPKDHFILDATFFNLICTVYDETDTNWYNKNRASALAFISGPLFPIYAVEQLGYPSNGLDCNGIAAGFNLPIKTEPKRRQ
jgi:hypothetical protein